MKKTSVELEKDLNDARAELKYLNEKYPRYYKDKGLWKHTPLSRDIIEKYEFLYSRIRNLEINVNQMKMRESNS